MDVASLYRLVPAAEEEDLLEEVARERLRRRYADLHDEDPEPEPLDQSDEPPLTPAQVLGLVQHRLGGVVLEVVQDEVSRIRI